MHFYQGNKAKSTIKKTKKQHKTKKQTNKNRVTLLIWSWYHNAGSIRNQNVMHHAKRVWTLLQKNGQEIGNNRW